MALLGLLPGKHFWRGVHVPENKDQTSHLPIRRLPFAPLLVVPLSQHTGAPAIPIVREGQEVVRGEPIAEAGGFVSVPMHAPATGSIERIALAPNARGELTKAIFIKPYPSSSQEVLYGAPQDIEKMTPEEIVKAVQATGVVGLGGAAFPTHVKMKVPDGKKIDTVVVNGCECEPYLTTDHRIMLEQPAQVLHGARVAMRAVGAYAGGGRRGRQQNGRGGCTARSQWFGDRHQHRGRADQVSAGRGKDAGEGAAESRDSLWRIAGGCRTRGVQRGDARADRRPAAAPPGA